MPSATRAASAFPPALDYRPLSVANNEIRILVIEPADRPDRQIACRIEHVPLSSTSQYVAVSYCWGRPEWTWPVQINGQTHYITPSLAGALMEIRRRGHLRVWADAICINQTDVEERSQQVLRMAAIYRSALAVVAWLGAAGAPDIDGIKNLITRTEELLAFNSASDRLQGKGVSRHKAGSEILDKEIRLRNRDALRGGKLRTRALERVVRGIRTLLDHREILRAIGKDAGENSRKALKHIQRHLPDSRWQCLKLLLNCEYWGRVWIIQELAMANKLDVVWGHHVFDLVDLADILTTYGVLQKAGLVGSESPIPERARHHVVNLHNFMRLQSQLKPVPLISALQSTTYARSTDERDKIYGLMGLTYDGPLIFPAPSYGRSIRDISGDATLRVINLERSLDHIILCGGATGSWRINWFDSTTWSDPRIVKYLTSSSTFYTSNGTHKKWTAAGSSQPSVDVEGDALIVTGAVLATVRDCLPTYRETVNKQVTIFKPLPGPRCKKSKRKKRHICSKDVDANRLRHNLFKTFCIAQRSSTSSYLGITKAWEFYRGIQYALDPSLGIADGNPTKIYAWLTALRDEGATLAGHDLYDWVRWDRYYDWKKHGYEDAKSAISAVAGGLGLDMRLGSTTEGDVGWFSKGTRPGDVVAVLLGCSVPAVLRLREDGAYMAVGDCIIPGMMQGEEAPDREESEGDDGKDDKDRWVKIRLV